jgi:uncharacterized protein YjiS (DUF1127 family)
MLAVVRETLRDAYVTYATAQARAAAARDLGHLSDHLLRDIGLRRDQVGAALREDQPWS